MRTLGFTLIAAVAAALWLGYLLIVLRRRDLARRRRIRAQRGAPIIDATDPEHPTIKDEEDP